jgi:hypothetical protein
MKCQQESAGRGSPRLRLYSPPAPHAATLALIARLRAGDGGPAVPVTRRVAPDGREVLVDLAAAPFGAGPHACPGQPLALYLAGADHQ